MGLIDPEFARYKSPGQRAAVRSAIVLPAGGTLVVNLPTGAGKTLVMLAAVQTTPPGMTSVIVVPTVALALDQERRYRSSDANSPQTAYHGGLSAEAKREFRERIWSGNQRVIFTNPEAVVSSLARPLIDAAKGGRLAVLGIDEVHVVGSWGDAFRPHFHSLAGLRRHMLREMERAGQIPFKTILASATLTEDVLLLLRTLFGNPGPFHHVAAPVVRPEPSYWQATDLPSTLRDKYLVETMRHMPRPAIVYTTLRGRQPPGTLTPRSAVKVLKDQGFQRIEVVDGGSSTAHREMVLRSLRPDGDTQPTIDVVVATSAFGLGIDVPDIRSVVHACVPENVDRFYQEVGRGGRDGLPSISILLATHADEGIADSLASPTYLTADRARERWTAMSHSSRSVSANLVRLPLTATSGQVAEHSDYNERWNLFTVILLARAGAIEWDFSLSEVHEGEEMESDRGWLTVRLLRGDHQTDQFWSGVVEPTRRTMVENSRKGLSRLRGTLNGQQCTGVLIAESFSIKEPSEFRTTCLVSCGGCRWCRAHGRVRWTSSSPLPSAIAVKSYGKSQLDRLAVDGAYGRRLALHVDTAIYASTRKMRGLVLGLVAASGARLIVAEGSLAERLRKIVSGSPSLVHIMMIDTQDDYDPTTAPGVTTIVFLSEDQDIDPWVEGSDRADLTVVCGSRRAPLGRSGLVLADLDGSYSMYDLEALR